MRNVRALALAVAREVARGRARRGACGGVGAGQAGRDVLLEGLDELRDVRETGQGRAVAQLLVAG